MRLRSRLFSTSGSVMCRSQCSYIVKQYRMIPFSWLMSGAELLSADRHVPGGFRVVQGGGLDDLQRERAALLSLPGDRGAEHGPIMSARYYCVNPV
jgi:hypothetical protein